MSFVSYLFYVTFDLLFLCEKLSLFWCNKNAKYVFVYVMCV
jgi:hypothetical protein